MTVLSFGNTAIVIDRVVAIQCGEALRGDEPVRVCLEGLVNPVELVVEDPETTYLEICAAISRLQTPGIQWE